MAPIKKKKKAVSNPARGVSTVSKPSKKVGEKPTSEDAPEDIPINGESAAVKAGAKNLSVLENGLRELRFMSPEELEQHLEKAETQTFLETHGLRAKRDAHRQVRRFETERRNFRRNTPMLETESWLQEVIDETLDLAKSSLLDQRKSVTTDVVSSKEDLHLKLWTVQLALKGLSFGNVDNALTHLIGISSTISKPESNSLWGFDEALTWLALNSDPNELPAYMQDQNSAFAAYPYQAHPVVADQANDEINDASDSVLHAPSTHPPSVEVGPCNIVSPTSESQANEAKIDHQPTMTSSDDSDSDDPDNLTDKFLDAQYELLDASLNGTDNQRLAHRLEKRIQRIERDVLFDRNEAVSRWTQIRRDFEIGHARSRDRRTKESNSAIERYPKNDSLLCKSGVDNDAVEDDIFGSIFDAAESSEAHDVATLTNTITLLDLGPIGAGASPRKVLEEICRVSDPGSRVFVRQIYNSPRSFRHRVRIEWSKDSDVEASPSYLPAKLSYEFQARSSSAAMTSIAASSPSHSEGYVCTVMMFIISQSGRDEKVYLRLQTVWRDVWKGFLDAQQQEVDKVDADTLEHIQGLVCAARSTQKAENKHQLPELESSPQGQSRDVRSLDTLNKDLNPESLKSVWKAKASTAKYQKMLRVRQQLPIWEHRHEITSTIDAHQVTILCAETGAGKSTQVPSFVLESYLAAGRECNILVTQPRRISAITLARRISEELGEEKSAIGQPGSAVGFAIRLESKVSSTTRIRYVTTGVLLRMLEHRKNLEQMNCVILDEVHERTMDMDLLFIVLRRLLKHRQDLKIVLMSATVDARKFSEYFDDAPILTIPGRTFPVEIQYLEDAVELTGSRDNDTSGSHLVESYDKDAIDSNESERVKSVTIGLQNYSLRTRRMLADYDEYKIDYSLIANLVAAIASEKQLRQYSKAILIFMPGIGEIRRLHQVVQSLPMLQSGWSIHLLHSSFSNDDLERAFQRPPPQHRKIVIATNIAETGITIPDVTAVIDSCREKIMRFDERRQISKLTEAFVSRSSARQRRGRAARVQAGLCFHLVTRYRYDHLLLEHHIPEMLRLSLQDPILRIKVWNLGAIEQTLNEAFDPPTSKNVRRAIQLLQDVKALSSTESLTSLGRQLAKLPLDIWLGKMVLYGVTFACLDAAAFIAAMLSAKSPFLDGDRSEGGGAAAAAKMAFNKGNSDLLLVYNAYCGWRRACRTGNIHEFCRKNFLNHATLSQIEEQKVQLLTVISDAGMMQLDEDEQDMLRRYRLSGRGVRGGSSSSSSSFYTLPDRYNQNSNNEFAINSVIATALYPKLLVRETPGWRNVSNNQQVNISPTSINHHRHRHDLVSSSSSSSSPAPASPPTHLSFYQTIQTSKPSSSSASASTRLPTVFQTSPVSPSALATVVVPNTDSWTSSRPDPDSHLYAGVISLDNGRLRFKVRDWKTMVAVRALRDGVQNAIRAEWSSMSTSTSTFTSTDASRHSHSGRADRHGVGASRRREVAKKWLDIWQRILDIVDSGPGPGPGPSGIAAATAGSAADNANTADNGNNGNDGGGGGGGGSGNMGVEIENL